MSYYLTNAGGQNKTHGQAERVPCLDSFEIRDDYSGCIFIGNSLTRGIFLDYGVYYDGDYEGVEFWYNGTPLKEGLTIARLQNGFGIRGQTFWVCPACGKRRRYIYLKDKYFRCRSCAKLNYKRQQDNVDSMFWYRLGMEYAREHFAPPPYFIDGFTFSDWTPERPRYQHHTTYQKHLVRFRRYQLHHAEKMAAELASIIGKCGVP